MSSVHIVSSLMWAKHGTTQICGLFISNFRQAFGQLQQTKKINRHKHILVKKSY